MAGHNPELERSSGRGWWAEHRIAVEPTSSLWNYVLLSLKLSREAVANLKTHNRHKSIFMASIDLSYCKGIPLDFTLFKGAQSLTCPRQSVTLRGLTRKAAVARRFPGALPTHSVTW